MNSASAISLVRKSTVAALLAGAALLLGACSTAPVAAKADRPVEKTVTYKELHSLMVKLSQEPALGTVSSGGSLTSLSSGSLGGGSVVAVNQ